MSARLQHYDVPMPATLAQHRSPTTQLRKSVAESESLNDISPETTRDYSYYDLALRSNLSSRSLYLPQHLTLGRRV